MKSELTSFSGVRLIPVTPGSFIMGSPQHEVGHEFWEGERDVTLTYEFYLGATPVTHRQFELVTGENPVRMFAAHPKTAGDAPVDSVWWQAATEFCAQLTEIDPAGEKFDPHRHQAMQMVESDQPANTVVQVFQKGYALNDRILRPALVTVAKG